MEMNTTLFNNIADNSELPKTITKIAVKLGKKTSLKSDEDFWALQDLSYWLYVMGKMGESKELCSLVKDTEKVDDKVRGIFVLYSRILREEGNITEAKLYADRVKDSYSEKQKTLKRILNGSLLYDDKIEAFVKEGNEERANVWRFAQISRLCFIHELGGSETFTEDALEAKINEIKTILANSLPKPKPVKAPAKKKAAGTIKDYWKRIENYVAKNNPDLDAVLQKGANTTAIKELEKVTGIKFPKDFTDFYKIHNGQTPNTTGIINNDGLPEELLSVERMLDEWKIWKGLIDKNDFEGSKSDPDTGIKDDWYNEKWIPITYDGCGNHICIDFSPANEGNEGQIIRMWHDDASRVLIASTFKQWLADFVNDIEEDD